MKRWIVSCLHNTLIIYVLAVAICVAGIVTLFSTGITPFPSMNSKSIGLLFSYPGANAQTVQAQITSKVVQSVRSLNNIQRITAVSQAGSSYLNLRLNDNRIDQMLQSEMQILQAVASSNLPSVVPQPQIFTAGTNSGIVGYAFMTTQLSQFQLDNLIAARLTPKMQSIPYVYLQTYGEAPVIRIALEPNKLAEYHLDAPAIAQKLDQIYHASPLGKLYFNQIGYTLNSDKPISSLAAWKTVVVGYQGQGLGKPIYLEDIATIHFEPRSITNSSYLTQNGVLAGGIFAMTHSYANPITAAKLAAKYVKQFLAPLGGLVHSAKLFDNGANMKEAITDVLITLVVTVILVILVSLIFLGRWKTTLIPIATIPICLLGTIAGLKVIGYIPNTLTLLALVIAIGLVVDDAIVVIENITRYIESGIPKRDAVLTATANIGKTVIGITATLLAVYTPILFSTWDMAIIFKAFAITLSIAVFLSGIAALTLTPVMAMSLIPHGGQTSYQKRFDQQLNHFIAWYQRGLKACLKHPWIAIVVILVLLAAAVHVAKNVPIKVFPQDYSGSVSVTLKGGPEDTVQTLKTEAARFKPFYQNEQVKFRQLSIQTDQQTGILTATLTFMLKKADLKKSGLFSEKLTTFIKHQKLTNASADAQNTSNWGDNYDLSFYLYGATLKAVNNSTTELTKLMQGSGLFSHVENEIQQPKRQLQFKVNTVLAAKYGLYENDLSNFLSTYYGGYQLQNNFSMDGLSVPVLVQLGKNNLKSEDSLQKLMIKSPTTGLYLPVSQFVSLQTVAKPNIINTFNNMPTVMLNANLNTGVSLSTAIHAIQQLVETHTPNMQVSWSGNAEEYLQGSSASTLIFVTGILCIYLILALIFKSILDPFIIMLTVPFSVLGGMLTLYLFGSSINIYSALGLITLVGLITKHGVLIVQFANSELEKGAKILDAVITATHHRFRPIIMTTLAMVFGVLPLTMSSGQLYGARMTLGITIIGGLLIGTLFSLFIVPVVYLLITQLRMATCNRKKKTTDALNRD